MNKDVKKPKWSLIIPCKGKIMAPPETPIIIKAETSFERVGLSFNAYEKIIEKTLAQVNPIMKIKAISIHKFDINMSRKNVAIAISNDIFK